MKTKAIITILISLMIGFILGFITEGQLVKREKNKWRRISYSRIFEERIIEIITPTELQKEQISPIIRSYSQKMSELRQITSQKLDELRTDMHKELKQFLTEEQFNRLQEKKDRHPDRRRSPRTQPPAAKENAPGPEEPKN